MLLLDELDGITGFRWGALLEPGGSISFSEKAPEVDKKKIMMLARLLSQSSLRMNHSDLRFDMGKVLIRRGIYGFLLLFCDDNVSVSMVDILLDEPDTATTSISSFSGNSSGSSGSDSDARLSLVQSLDMDNRNVPDMVLEELLDLYAEFLGPLARALVAKDARDNGINLKPLAGRNWSNLLNIMAARFDMESKREDFLDRAVLFKARF